MEDKTSKLLEETARYFSAKLAEHGETPCGVDWNGEASQVLRFEQLLKVLDLSTGFSLNDLGCGYGALYGHLKERFKSFTYSGYDISEDMVHAAKKRYVGDPRVCFSVASEPTGTADYGIASGIFNLRFGRNDTACRDFLEATLETLNRTSLRGFAFNCLTSYSDADKMESRLYYADPCALFDLCRRRYSRHVALLHDYGLYDFTILVKKHA